MSEKEKFEIQISDELKNLPSTLNNLINTSKVFTQIASRSGDPNERRAELKIFDETSLQKIADFMPTINEKCNIFGRQNTNVTNKLMTLNMLTDGHPLRTARQCLAQIESKRGAIFENMQRLKRKNIEAQRKMDNMTEIESEISELNEKRIKLMIQLESSNGDGRFAKELKLLEKQIKNLYYSYEELKIDMEDLAAGVADSRVYIEGAIKEIASFQQAYKEICKNKNIPENWDEKTFDESECGFHIRTAFLHAYRDTKAHGTIGHGTLDYLQQFGVSPDQATLEIKGYFMLLDKKLTDARNNAINNNQPIPSEVVTYDDLETWLDEMEEKYKNHYKFVMKRMGLDNLSEDWYIYKNVKQGD